MKSLLKSVLNEIVELFNEKYNGYNRMYKIGGGLVIEVDKNGVVELYNEDNGRDYVHVAKQLTGMIDTDYLDSCLEREHEDIESDRNALDRWYR